VASSGPFVRRPRGVGKTRLALEVAEALHTRERISVLWVAADAENASPVTAPGRPQSLLANWVRALVADRGAFDELAPLLGDRTALPVLDGYDGMVSMGSALTSLLHSCPGLRILVTTREPHWSAGGLLGEDALYDQGVRRRPRAGPHSGQPVDRRPVAGLLQNACGVRDERLPRRAVAWGRGPSGVGGAQQSQTHLGLVALQPGRPDQFRQPALAQPALEVELGGAQAGGDVPLGEEEVVVGLAWMEAYPAAVKDTFTGSSRPGMVRVSVLTAVSAAAESQTPPPGTGACPRAGTGP
jgi:hypothetical protein